MAYRTVALIPAAGKGTRIGESTPKQYVLLNGKPMLHYPLQTLCGIAAIDHVYVVIDPRDQFWGQHDWPRFNGKLSVLRCGGASRAQSVLNGLNAIAPHMADDNWVLVHDAARPGLQSSDVTKLIKELAQDEVGGLLALPLPDTLKQGDAEQRTVATVPRENLWLAQTPQMFRYGLLKRALNALPADSVTDEAQAIEALGLKPKLVSGSAANFKVTYPGDIALMQKILK
ncbi:MAG: 2-C-methyl-D-erythritol 4-phosphate cytidylyltransferase [Burkholderiales bacterium]